MRNGMLVFGWVFKHQSLEVGEYILSGKTEEVKSEGWFKISRAQKSFSFMSTGLIMITNELVRLLKVEVEKERNSKVIRFKEREIGKAKKKINKYIYIYTSTQH